MSVFGFRDFLRRHLTPEQRRIIKFLVVGTSGVPVNLGTVYLATILIPVVAFDGLRDWLSEAMGIATLTAAGLRDVLAYGLAIVVSILTNFLLNNYWTWGDRVAGDDRSQFLRRLAKFYLVSSVAAVVQLGTSAVVSAMVRGNAFFAYSLHGDYRVYHAFAPMVGILFGLAINFIANNLWTFRHKHQG